MIKDKTLPVHLKYFEVYISFHNQLKIFHNFLLHYVGKKNI